MKNSIHLNRIRHAFAIGFAACAGFTAAGMLIFFGLMTASIVARWLGLIVV